MGERIKDNIKQILATHEVTPILEDVLREMKSVVEKADAEHGGTE